MSTLINHEGTERLLHGVIARVMREEGFLGETEIVSTRMYKTKYVCVVDATCLGTTVRYRASISAPGYGRKVKIERMSK